MRDLSTAFYKYNMTIIYKIVQTQIVHYLHLCCHYNFTWLYIIKIKNIINICFLIIHICETKWPQDIIVIIIKII